MRLPSFPSGRLLLLRSPRPRRRGRSKSAASSSPPPNSPAPAPHPGGSRSVLLVSWRLPILADGFVDLFPSLLLLFRALLDPLVRAPVGSGVVVLEEGRDFHREAPVLIIPSLLRVHSEDEGGIVLAVVHPSRRAFLSRRLGRPGGVGPGGRRPRRLGKIRHHRPSRDRRARGAAPSSFNVRVVEEEGPIIGEHILRQVLNLIYTGGGKSGPSVCTDPSTLLLFATLQAISRAPRPKSLGPAERICIRRTLGFWEGSREHRQGRGIWAFGPTWTVFGFLRNPQSSSWRPGGLKIPFLGP